MFKRFLLLLVATTTVAWAQAKLTTIAGASYVFPGNGAAASLPLGGIADVAVDSSGNVYAADRDNNLIVKITPSGALTVLAGTGTGIALGTPYGLAVDSSGNVYWAEPFSNQIQKLTPGLVLSTVAGPATGATLNLPRGLAVDAAGNLYIADTNNHCIRKVDTSGIISTVAGNGIAGFTGDGGAPTSASLRSPNGVAVDSSGNLYIADSGNGRIRKVTFGASPRIATLAGGGTLTQDGVAPTAAFLNFPYGVAVDSLGNVYVADPPDHRVRKVSGPAIATVAGTGIPGFAGDGGAAAAAVLNSPSGVALDAAGTMYIADADNDRIRMVSAGVISTFAGSGLYRFGGDGGPAVDAFLNGPRAVAVDSAGNVFIADEFNQRIRMIDLTGRISTVAGNGVATYAGDGLPATGTSLNFPSGVAVDSMGNTYISDTNNGLVRKVAGNIMTTVAGGGINLPGDGGLATHARLFSPVSVAVDSAGNFYFCDYPDARVRKVTGLTISTVAGTAGAGFSGDGGPAVSAQVNNPFSVAADGTGNLYIADTDNHRIRKVSADATPIITTIAGVGTAGFSGDGGPATDAQLNSPFAVAVDAAGNLYIGDSFNSLVRKVGPDGTITTVASGIEATGMAVDAAGRLYIADFSSNRLVLATGVAPDLLSISPVNIASAADFTLNVNGTGFDRDAIVQWNGRARPTTYIDSQHLQAAIASSDITASRFPVVTVRNPSLGGATSNLLVAYVLLPVYLVGDSYPFTGDTANLFGDGHLDNFDLIAGLRAVTSLPGSVPALCSDRFDAMDSFPEDGAERGGNGLLDNLDLIATLRRLTGLDSTLPRRITRSGCPASAMSRVSRQPPSLEMGDPGKRVSIYFTAPRDQDLHGLSFSLGLPEGSRQVRLRFAPGELGRPTLLDNALPGMLALAWLDELPVVKGQRILLGYVEMPAAARLEVFGGDAGQPSWQERK